MITRKTISNRIVKQRKFSIFRALDRYWSDEYNYYYASSPCRFRQKARNAYTPARAGFVGDTANETDELVPLNMAAPVRGVSDMRDNPKTINRIGVYIYNGVGYVLF